MALNWFPWFPDIYQTLINNFSGTKKYIDASVGSNSNDGNSETSAYSTIEYAQSQTSGVSTAVMYVINPGTYNLTPVIAGSASAGISDYNLPRIFVCSPDNRVILQWTAESSPRDAPMVSFQNSTSAIYGAVLKRNNNGKSLNYSVAMFNGSTAHCQGDFYNCVFVETNANGNWSLQYDNAAGNNSTINNCTVYTIEAGAEDYSGGAGLVLNNCAFNYTYGTSGATKTNTVINQTIDANTYALSTDNTTYGVYSGTYAWGQPLTSLSFQINGTNITSANEGDTVTVEVRGSIETGNLNYTISGVSSADINGASLTGSVTLINGEATLTIVLSEDFSSNEGTETLTIVVEDPAGNLQETLTVVDSSAILFVTPSAVPGDVITVRLNTGNNPQPDGTQIPYTISGTNITAGLIGQPLTGNFVVNDNTAEFTITIGVTSSTTLLVTSFGETASCSITFTPTISVDVVESDYTDTEVNTPAFSILPFSAVPITQNTATNIEPGFVQVSTGAYLDYAEPTTLTDTVQNGGAMNIYIVRPLGQELIREFWI